MGTNDGEEDEEETDCFALFEWCFNGVEEEGIEKEGQDIEGKEGDEEWGKEEGDEELGKEEEDEWGKEEEEEGSVAEGTIGFIIW